MDWIPLVDRVLILSNKKETTDSGLFIPDSFQDDTGKVVAIGPGVYDSRTGNTVPTVLEVGDSIKLPVNAHSEEVVINQVKYMVFREVDLLLYNPTQRLEKNDTPE